MHRKILFLSLLMFALTGGAAAQDTRDKTPFDVAALPLAAATVEKFVPAGWLIETTTKGDLSGDGVPDAALKLVEKPKPNDDKDIRESGERVLLVLFKDAKGEFERVASAERLLQCTGCGGALYGGTDAPADVTIEKGVLIVKENFGSRETTDLTFRFRYNAATKKFPLIGFDLKSDDSATGEMSTESSNYLTGVKITETFQYSKKLEKYVKQSTNRTQNKIDLLVIEEINYEQFTGEE